MKILLKILLVIIVIALIGLGFFAYKIYTPNQKDLGVVIDQQMLNDIQKDFEVEFPDSEVINSDKILKVTEYREQDLILNNEQSSVLLALALSTVLPVSNVQAVNYDNQIDASMLVNLSEDLKNQIGSPVPLPDQVGAYIIISVTQNSNPIIVDVTSFSMNGIDMPQSVSDQIEGAIVQVFKDNGFELIEPTANQLHVKGNLPSKFE